MRLNTTNSHESLSEKITLFKRNLLTRLSNLTTYIKYSILLPMRRRLRDQEFKQKLIIYGLLGIGGLIVLGFLVTFALFAWYSRSLPEPGKLSQATNSSTIFYDRNGKVLFELYKDKNRVPVSIKDISLHPYNHVNQHRQESLPFLNLVLRLRRYLLYNHLYPIFRYYHQLFSRLLSARPNLE